MTITEQDEFDGFKEIGRIAANAPEMVLDEAGL